MNEMEKLFKKYGLGYRSNLHSSDLTDMLHWAIKGKMNKTKTEKECIQEVCKEVYRDKGILVIEDHKIFCEAMGLDEKYKEYPRWFFSLVQIMYVEIRNGTLLWFKIDLADNTHFRIEKSIAEDSFYEPVINKYKLKKMFDENAGLEVLNRHFMETIDEMKTGLKKESKLHELKEKLEEEVKKAYKEVVQNA